MRRRASVRGGDHAATQDDWYGMSWSCECDYTNVGTDRCYFCGSRAPQETLDKAAAGAAASTEVPAAGA